MKQFLWLMILCLPLIMHAQEEKGIQWTTGLSWEQVKEKAKAENKYIFLDCYATWCGPCKMMDKEVYTDNSVGQLFNEKFISIKVQMDKTKNDDPFVQSWYNDASMIAKRYFVNSFPTFLFFKPTGEIIHNQPGYKDVAKFIIVAETALLPGKKYDDSYPQYEQLLKAYNAGEIDYDALPFMVTVAKKLNDTISKKLLRLHEDYVSGLSKEQRYTRENIKFWSTLQLTPDRKIVQFFHKDGKIIDRIVGQKSFANAQVDKSIQNFTVIPFVTAKLLNKNPKAVGMLHMLNTKTGVVTSLANELYDRVDMDSLYKAIRSSFDKKSS